MTLRLLNYQKLAYFSTCVGMGVCGSGLMAEEAKSEFSAEALHFFETSVRPVLAEHCYECHSASKSHADLRLDSRAAILKGGDHGSVVSLEDVGSSRLLKAIRHQEGVPAMPSKRPQLPANQIEAIERWIAEGMAWPDEVPAEDRPSAEAHWAFVPPVKPEVPSVSDPAWAGHPVDAFLYQVWQAEGVKPTPLAPVSVWNRRAWNVLMGLPPSKGEVEQKVADEAEWASRMQGLIANPAFGERMARRWMDVARYSDTKGYLAGNVDMNLPFSFSYRDWLVQAFNQDLPYNEFVRQQLAADQMVEVKDGQQELAALGFLTVGRRDGNRQEILDDWIDVTTRGFMGLTVACARCHDHKTDPVSAADYYAMYGIFNNTNEPDPIEMPIVGEIPQGAANDEFNQQLAEANAELDRYHKYVEDHIHAPEEVAAYLEYSVASRDWDDGKVSGVLGDRTKEDIKKEEEKNKHLRYRIRLMRAWQNWLAKHGGDQNEKILGLWQQIARAPAEGFEGQVLSLSEALRAQEGASAGSKALAEQMLASQPKNLREASRVLADFLIVAEQAPDERQDLVELRGLLRQGDSPLNWRGGEVHRVFDQTDNAQRTERRNKITSLLSSHAGAPARAMIVRDRDKMEKAVVFRRGNPGMRGDEVPRRWLSHFGGDEFSPENSGRLELAEKIVARENPLTARIWVNRVWAHVFGAPLVDSPSDFGVQTPEPRHQELLDYLAVWFMDNGWSTKKLTHLLVTSKAFRLDSDPLQAPSENLSKDAANAFFWHGNRRRLEFESLRDQFLIASGELKVEQPTPGRALKWDQAESNGRRSLYLVNDRYQPYEVARVFDQPVGEQHTPIRYETAVPQQMLFFLNSPFVRERAEKTIQLPEFQRLVAEGNPRGAAAWLYERVFGRAASEEELAVGERFIVEGTEEPHGPDFAQWNYESAILRKGEDGSVSFEDVKPLAHFVGHEGRWRHQDLPQGDPNYYLGLNPHHGHPGSERAPILTWIPDRDGVVKAKVKITRGAEAGDGVVVWWMKGDQLLKQHHVQPKEEWSDESLSFEAKAGEPVRLMIHQGNDQNHDSFHWSLTYTDGEGKVLADGAKDFLGNQGIPLSWAQRRVPWADYVQALFSSNEFSFVD